VPKEVYNFKGKEVQKVQKKQWMIIKRLQKQSPTSLTNYLETVHWNKPFSVEYGV